MEAWFTVLIALCIPILLKSLFKLLTSSTGKNLPPGPFPLPILGNILSLRTSPTALYKVVRSLHAKYGPIVTLYIGSHPTIFVSTGTLSHEALVQKGASFASRPPTRPPIKFANRDKEVISSAPYGLAWRHLRGNLTSKFLNQTCIRSFSPARKWALETMINSLESQSKDGASPVQFKEHFEHMMLRLLVFMCFGEKIEDDKLIETLQEIEETLVRLSYNPKLNVWPKLGRILFYKEWNTLFQVCEEQDHIIRALINSRRKLLKAFGKENYDVVVPLTYVDTLLELELPEYEGRSSKKIEEGHIVSLCSEFLASGNHTTSSVFPWIMANVVKYPHVQEKLYTEIAKVVGSGEEAVKEEQLSKVPYVRAVVLESLRRHPLGHFALPHAVAKDTMLSGYSIPKGSSIIFNVADLAWDPQVWEDPIEFNPERFMVSGGEDHDHVVFDVTGSKEIKMMPFGVGRRICAGYALAMLHMEHFLANLVWRFQWRPVEDGVDLTAKEDPALVMKNPLKAYITPRNIRK